MKLWVVNKRKLFLFFMFFISMSLSASAKVVEKGEREILLNKYWEFKTDPYNQGIQNKWFEKKIQEPGWMTMVVPSNWDLYNEYSNYKGKAWYRTSFTLPFVGNKRILLSLGEVGMSYSLFLNGKLITSILSGNQEEQFDISDYLLVGKNNTLAIEVDNTLSWGAYWSWGGIRRPVKILVRDLLSIQQQQIVAIPDLSEETAAIQTSFLIHNADLKERKVQVYQTLYFNDSLVKKSVSYVLTAPAGQYTKFDIRLKLPKEQTHLWHFDHPNLYKSKISLSVGKGESYVLQDRFGIRKIEIEGRQFKLNGKSVRLAGYNWVADDRTTGDLLPEFRYKQDIDLMKAAGANMARISHRPLPDDVMDYLDEKGILVLAEFNNWPPFMNGKSKEPQLFATKLIQQNFNHPSVFGWSVGNENGNLKEFPEVNEYVKSIIQYIKQNLDSNRLVTYVSNTADFQDNDAAQYCDIIMINKYGNYAKGIDALQAKYPEKLIFMSEYGSHTDNLIYDTPDKTLFKSLMVDSIRSKQNLIGYSLWTFNDYRSTYQAPNPATTTPLHQNRQWGIVDVYRNKKRAFAQMQKFYAPIKKMTVSVSNIEVDSTILDIQITPRSLYDIPSFELNDYSLVVEGRNEKNTNEFTDFISLPQILPGSNSLNYKIKVTKNKVSFAKVSFLSPQGYIVLDTVLNFKIPPPPVVQSFIKASNTARVVFVQNQYSKSYIVRYSIDGVIKSMPPTIDHYVDLINLPLNKICTIWVTATNDSGVSDSSKNMTFIPTAGYDVLPPIIWLSEPADEGFFVGYSHHYADLFYQIRYGTSLTDMSSWKVISSSNFGMSYVPNLLNGKKYYYQLLRRSGFNTSANCWTEIREIIPNAKHEYGQIQLHGFVQKENHVLISCTPSKNATQYIVHLNTNKGLIKHVFSFGDINLLKVPIDVDTKVFSIQILNH